MPPFHSGRRLPPTSPSGSENRRQAAGFLLCAAGARSTAGPTDGPALAIVEPRAAQAVARHGQRARIGSRVLPTGGVTVPSPYRKAAGVDSACLPAGRRRALAWAIRDALPCADAGSPLRCVLRADAPSASGCSLLRHAVPRPVAALAAPLAGSDARRPAARRRRPSRHRRRRAAARRGRARRAVEHDLAEGAVLAQDVARWFLGRPCPHRYPPAP